MAHTNNLKRAARTHYPAISKKKKKVSTRQNAHSDYYQSHTDETVEPAPTTVEEVAEDRVATEEERAKQTELITEYHALEKKLAASTDVLEKRLIQARQQEIGGLQGYQAASLHGGDKARGGETGKWCIEQLLEIQAAKNDAAQKKSKRKGLETNKVHMENVSLARVCNARLPTYNIHERHRSESWMLERSVGLPTLISSLLKRPASISTLKRLMLLRLTFSIIRYLHRISCSTWSGYLSSSTL